MFRIVEASHPPQLNFVKALLMEYSKSLSVDLDFQNFSEELAGLPGDYSPPTGCILLAYIDDIAAGCVALRRIDSEICEMKRLFVKADYRKTGAGRILAESIVRNAKSLGYRKMRLDTLPEMKAARRLYVSLGFYEIEPYRFNPVAGTMYMELDLTSCALPANG